MSSKVIRVTMQTDFIYLYFNYLKHLIYYLFLNKQRFTYQVNHLFSALVNRTSSPPDFYEKFYFG